MAIKCPSSMSLMMKFGMRYRDEVQECSTSYTEEEAQTI